MTIDLSDVRVTHGSAEAAAGSEATVRIRGRYATVSFSQGFRAGWWAAVAWALEGQDTRGVLHTGRATEVHVTLRQAGVHRDIRHIDHAIEDALEALHADTGNRLDTSHDQDWEHIEGHMLALLDLTPTEWAAWAAYEATA